MNSGKVFPAVTNIYVPKHGITLSSDYTVVLMYEDNTTQRNKYFQHFNSLLTETLGSIQVTGSDKFVNRLLQKVVTGNRLALTFYSDAATSYMRFLQVSHIGARVNIAEIQFQGCKLAQVSQPVTHLDYFDPYIAALLMMTYN